MAVSMERTRAKLGARLLDLFKPGWHREIKLDTLALESCSSCVLGQLFGDYGAGAERIFAMRRNPDVYYQADIHNAAEEAGFCIDADRLSGNYDTLTESWKAEIRKRLRAEAPKRARQPKQATARVFCDSCGTDKCATPIDRMGQYKIAGDHSQPV